MTDLSNFRRKTRTALRLAVKMDVRGLATRFRKAYKKIQSPADLAKERFLNRAREALDQFFFCNGRIGLDTVPDPEVTVVLILWNKAELTYQCLQSLTSVSSKHLKLGVLIIDNASSDVTEKLLSRVDGATIVKNTENVGFLKACNQARDLVSSPYFLFLNNDTIVHPGAIEAALACIREDPEVGAVGARIILPSGKLQEAGNIIWSDGTCVGYARGRPADAPEAMFRRYTDYGSGAFLLTRTELFKRFGGFDERYLPAYYEETDFCVNLWRAGYKIVYEPRATITHFEFGSAELSERAFALMSANRIKFFEKHKEYLATKDPPPATGTRHSLHAFRVPKELRRAKRILFIEDRVPNCFLGAGFPRSNNTVNLLCQLGYELTTFAMEDYPHAWSDVYEDLDPRIESVSHSGKENLASFLKEREGCFDAIWICRPDNLDFFWKHCAKVFSKRRPPIIYDGEAIFSDREKIYFDLFGKYRACRWTSNEMEFALAKDADVIVAVSEAEAKKWRAGTGRPTYVLGHEYRLHPTESSFTSRKDFLFVGSLHGKETPNGDSIEWFLTKVMPLIKRKLNGSVRLLIAGFNALEEWEVLEEHASDVEVLGRVDNLRRIYEKARVVVVPTRYAAGIPQKAFDAAEHAVPVVCTDLIADQMGWSDGEHALVAKVNDAERFAAQCAELYTNEALWAKIREGSMAYMRAGAQSYDLKKNLSLCLEQAFSLRKN